MIDHNSQLWFTAAKLAAMDLPGLPKNKRKMNELIKREGWVTRVDRLGFSLARKRQARGGGFEYNFKLLPPTARRRLVSAGVEFDGLAGDKTAIPLWNWFNQQPACVRGEAQRRLEIVEDVMLNCEQGATKTASIASSAAYFSVSTSTVRTWLRMIRGCQEADWLPHLAPRKILSKKEIKEVPDLRTLYHEMIKMSHQLAMLSVQLSTIEKRLSLNETEH